MCICSIYIYERESVEPKRGVRGGLASEEEGGEGGRERVDLCL
jgi:hypothetical protein